MAINQEVYHDECIIKRLIPFIQEYHRDGKYVYWLDLASSHYAKSVTDWLEQQKVPYVPKQMNPIEDFWAILKQEVYMDGWMAKNVDQLETRITFC